MSFFSGRVALVTGGGGGIGAEAARMMAHCGAHVLVLDIDGDKAKAVAAEIDGTAYTIDVSDPPSWDSLSLEHPPSVALLNAGVRGRDSIPYEIDEVSRAEVTRAMGANFLGVLHGMRRLVPAMRALGDGRICLNVSAAGLMPVAADPVYTATKHGVIGLGRSTAMGLEPFGVRVTMLCPTAVDTAMIGMAEQTIAYQMWGGLLAPRVVAQAALDLAEFGAAGEIRLVEPAGVVRMEPTFVRHPVTE
ncbi:MAG: SDR family NAD(P)-dependent oxidoreductase [Ilumatobacteraceae bacterium]